MFYFLRAIYGLLMLNKSSVGSQIWRYHRRNVHQIIVYCSFCFLTIICFCFDCFLNSSRNAPRNGGSKPSIKKELSSWRPNHRILSLSFRFTREEDKTRLVVRRSNPLCVVCFAYFFHSCCFLSLYNWFDYSPNNIILILVI